MKKFMGSIKSARRNSQAPAGSSNRSASSGRAPEDSITRDIKRFIDSSANPTSGDEVTHLPQIVEAAEASPTAAAAATKQIRKSLNRDAFATAYKQYHGIMLLRILIDNPGSCKHVQRNIDAKITENFKTLLRTHRDPSVQQIARETLEHFAVEKGEITELKGLVGMWLKEKAVHQPRPYVPRYAPGGHHVHMGNQAPHSDGRQRHALPDQAELAGRVEEARTSAKLLIQLTQSTPSAEFNSNELIREFADRCQSAQRSLTGYMNSEPPPDEETCQTLIETCEQLSLASSKHQRAALAARKQNKDGLVRAEQLYNGVGVEGSRDASPNASASGTASPPLQNRPAPAKSKDLNSFAPISRHASPREEEKQRASEPFNPFGDENASNFQPAASSGRYYGSASKASPIPPAAPYVELPTTSTPPPAGDSAFKSPAISGETVAPPPGPPPGRKPIAGHEDAYNGLGALDREQRRPLTADSDDLYGAHEPIVHSVTPHQDLNGTHQTSLPDRGKGRIKDDEPFSPVGGVSGSGWNY